MSEFIKKLQDLRKEMLTLKMLMNEICDQLEELFEDIEKKEKKDDISGN